MVHKLLLTVLLPPLGLLVSTIYSFVRNYALARKIGLPIVAVPISLDNLIWMLSARFVMPFVRRLPFGSGHFTRFGYVGWEFRDKSRVHQELGDAFTLVTPGTSWVYMCNADSIYDIIQRERRHDFSRPVEIMAMLDVFGPNISTVEGSDWQRQRKCTAATFNERNNRIVWAEALRQAREMRDYWTSRAAQGVSSAADDARTLALHVLLSAGFGKSYPFRSTTKADATGEHRGSLSYRESLALILENAILIVALGPKFLSSLTFPKRWARIGEATVAFKRYMAQALEEEKRLVDQGKPRSDDGDNLLTSLVRASAESNPQQGGLTQDEVFGNMFVFNFAGHDTTAHSLAYSLLLLAAHPEIQDWVNEEIQHVLPEDDESAWSYDRFPRMNRSLAVLYETLRLFDPLLSIVKTTHESPTPLDVGSKSIVIPPKTKIILNMQALHSHPRYWGDDCLEWRPQRWVKTVPGDGPAIDREEFITPPKGAFIAWSEGSRACPGKKFAQVEHVAVMAGLFRSYRAVPVRQAGEDEAAARERVKKVVDDTGMVLLLQMLHPEKAVVEWKKR
ncbi:putative cytochrome p450 protein [Neofusicoccum parvum UCRNP2]|uniref:Putative cytochrome p450 protein n=1 Tax=Botryosphaeria parva (strain UCR-NP2) TaxID=1287680 RepID=R1G0V4_BOTPV|nr:putative cytochrome p450 protein [Neofusicoccum parvum UCRNP2]